MGQPGEWRGERYKRAVCSLVRCELRSFSEDRQQRMQDKRGKSQTANAILLSIYIYMNQTFRQQAISRERKKVLVRWCQSVLQLSWQEMLLLVQHAAIETGWMHGDPQRRTKSWKTEQVFLHADRFCKHTHAHAQARTHTHTYNNLRKEGRGERTGKLPGRWVNVRSQWTWKFKSRRRRNLGVDVFF